MVGGVGLQQAERDEGATDWRPIPGPGPRTLGRRQAPDEEAVRIVIGEIAAAGLSAMVNSKTGSVGARWMTRAR